jgi:hypothetical protein
METFTKLLHTLALFLYLCLAKMSSGTRNRCQYWIGFAGLRGAKKKTVNGWKRHVLTFTSGILLSVSGRSVFWRCTADRGNYFPPEGQYVKWL